MPPTTKGELDMKVNIHDLLTSIGQAIHEDRWEDLEKILSAAYEAGVAFDPTLPGEAVPTAPSEAQMNAEALDLMRQMKSVVAGDAAAAQQHADVSRDAAAIHALAETLVLLKPLDVGRGTKAALELAIQRVANSLRKPAQEAQAQTQDQEQDQGLAVVR